MCNHDPGRAANEFLWAVGIENTFVPQTRAGHRRLDEYELMGHYQLWKQDLDLAADLGVSAIRYGIPWYKVNPQPGVFDWSWTDAVLEYLVVAKKLTPIVDLMHYGTPLWLENQFVNAAYPRRVAEYAARFAERYASLVRFYTPLNEPAVTAAYCGRTGRWPPYLSGDDGYVKVLVSLRGESAEQPRHCGRSGQTRSSSTLKISVSKPQAGLTSYRRLLLLRHCGFYPWILSVGGCSPDTPTLNGLSKMDARNQNCLIWPCRPRGGTRGCELLSVDQPPACPFQKRADSLGGWLGRTRLAEEVLRLVAILISTIIIGLSNISRRKSPRPARWWCAPGIVFATNSVAGRDRLRVLREGLSN